MKNKAAILGMFLIAAFLMVMPVSAADDMFLLSQDRGITPSFSYSFAGGGLSTAPNAFPLAIGDNIKDIGTITVSTNVPWTLKAMDSMGVGKPVGSGGKMAAMVFGGAYGSAFLTNPMNAKFNSGAYVPLSGTDQIVYSGSAMEAIHPLNLKQTIVAADPVLPAGSNYYLVIRLTGAATP